MGEKSPTRRRFTVGMLTASSIALAGCLGDDEDETDDEQEGATGDVGEDELDEIEAELSQEPTLRIVLENEDGDPAADEGNVVEVGNGVSYLFESPMGDDLENGEIEIAPVMSDGTYHVEVSSADGTFDTVEDEVEFTDEDIENDEVKEVSFTLDGASAAEIEDDE